jgi:hypothetical protein
MGLLVAATARSATAANSRAGTPTLVLVTTTDACQCTLDRCKVGRRELEKFLQNNPTEFALEVIDVSKVPEATKTYKTPVLPAAILRGATGTQIARFDGFFTEADLLQAWAKHLEAKERKR